MAIRSIPPNIVMRSTRPSRLPPAKKVYTTIKRRRKKPISKPFKFDGRHEVKEVYLDVFDEEDDSVKVIGDFPGIENIDDIVIQLIGRDLIITTRSDIDRKYLAYLELLDSYNYKIMDREVKNNIMTLVMKKTDYKDVPELESIFAECLKKFPELTDVELRVVLSRRFEDRDSLDGAMGKSNGKSVVILFIPKRLWGNWEAFRAIIYHELSHYIDLKNPDAVFYERADEKSIQLWDALKKANAMECKVDKKDV